jgi:hypothetical protein
MSPYEWLRCVVFTKIIITNDHLYFILDLHVGKHYNLSTSAKSFGL